MENDPSFYQWRKRLEQSNRQSKQSGRAGQGTAAKDPSSHFVPVNVVGRTEAEIELPNGMKVRVPVANVQLLRAAILAASDACREVA